MSALRVSRKHSGDFFFSPATKNSNVKTLVQSTTRGWGGLGRGVDDLEESRASLGIQTSGVGLSLVVLLEPPYPPGSILRVPLGYSGSGLPLWCMPTGAGQTKGRCHVNQKGTVWPWPLSGKPPATRFPVPKGTFLPALLFSPPWLSSPSEANPPSFALLRSQQCAAEP